MADANIFTKPDRANYLREKRSDHSMHSERLRLLIAIKDADQLGFVATKSALSAMLEEHDAKR